MDIYRPEALAYLWAGFCLFIFLACALIWYRSKKR